MANVTRRPFLRCEIGIILRRRRLKHRRAEIRSIAEILRVGVIREEGPAPSKTPAHIDVTSLIPTLRRVLQQIDAAHGKSRVNNCHVCGQFHPWQETQRSEWPSWTNSSRTGLRIVN